MNDNVDEVHRARGIQGFDNYTPNIALTTRPCGLLYVQYLNKD